ncbi:unnamed protein product, partial [Closterium sp. NIES-54]
DLSSNSLTGSIPDSITALRALGYLNLRKNNLTGPIPDSLPVPQWFFPSASPPPPKPAGMFSASDSSQLLFSFFGIFETSVSRVQFQMVVLFRSWLSLLPHHHHLSLLGAELLYVFTPRFLFPCLDHILSVQWLCHRCLHALLRVFRLPRFRVRHYAGGRPNMHAGTTRLAAAEALALALAGRCQGRTRG